MRVLRRRLGDARPVRQAEADYLHQSTAPRDDPDSVEQYALAPTGGGSVGAAPAAVTE